MLESKLAGQKGERFLSNKASTESLNFFLLSNKEEVLWWVTKHLGYETGVGACPGTIACSPSFSLVLKQSLQVDHMAVCGCSGIDSRVNNNGSSFHTANSTLQGLHFLQQGTQLMAFEILNVYL